MGKSTLKWWSFREELLVMSITKAVLSHDQEVNELWLLVHCWVGDWKEAGAFLQKQWLLLVCRITVRQRTAPEQEQNGNGFQTKSKLLVEFQIPISFLMWYLSLPAIGCPDAPSAKETPVGSGGPCACQPEPSDSVCQSNSDKYPDWDNQNPSRDLVVGLLINFNDNWISMPITQAASSASWALCIQFQNTAPSGSGVF